MFDEFVNFVKSKGVNLIVGDYSKVPNQCGIYLLGNLEMGNLNEQDNEIEIKAGSFVSYSELGGCQQKDLVLIEAIRKLSPYAQFGFLQAKVEGSKMAFFVEFENFLFTSVKKQAIIEKIDLEINNKED